MIVEAVTPQVDEGRFPAKCTAGEEVVVEADVFADGHDVLAAVLLWRQRGAAKWRETAMAPLGNDRWRASFTAAVEFATYEFTVEGWVDRRATWQHGLDKKIAAGSGRARASAWRRSSCRRTRGGAKARATSGCSP